MLSPDWLPTGGKNPSQSLKFLRLSCIQSQDLVSPYRLNDEHRVNVPVELCNLTKSLVDRVGLVD